MIDEGRAKRFEWSVFIRTKESRIERTIPVGNALLDRLTAGDRDDLLALGELVELKMGATLYAGNAEGAMPYIYFPIRSVASMLVTMENGDTIESATVGREGVVGMQVMFGSPRLFERWINQVPGAAYRVGAESMRAHFDATPALRDLVALYAQSFMASLALSVACNWLHVVVERCARWLLLTQDRVPGDAFALTHEFLALMLGVRRAGVSVAAATLQNAGFISYRRGHIRVLDRAGLESASCECYRAATSEYERLLGPADAVAR